MSKRKYPKLPRGYGSVVQKRGRWQAKWREQGGDGHPHQRGKMFDSEQEAIDHLIIVRQELRTGQYIESSERTVGDLVEDWLKRNLTNRRWQPSTYATYQNLAYTHVIPVIGALRVQEVNKPRLQHLIDSLVDRDYSAAYIGNIRLVLTGAFGRAVKIGVLKTNPATGLELPAKISKEPPWWPLTDVIKVLDYLADDPMWLSLYCIALVTGCRPGELRALKWDDIDLEGKRMVIRRTMTRDQHYSPVVGERTKTGDQRGVSLTDTAVVPLKAWRIKQISDRLAAKRWQDDGLVFTRDDGRYLPNTRWQVRHKEIIAATGVRPDVTPHGLRHTTATLLLEQNVHPLIVSNLLGHKSIEITLDVYSHVSTSLHEASLQQLEERIKASKLAQK